jgi:mannose-6-phosphate isomerase-like protein (cupin superfamily)
MTRASIASIAMLFAAITSAAAEDVRRVVTGIDENNHAVVQFDGRVPLMPGPAGLMATNLWITDSYPAGFSFKNDPATRPIGISPPDNGTKFRLVEFPPLDPATEAKLDPELLMKAVGDRAPKRGIPVKHPFMHRTRTVDYAVILSGEIDMMLDDASVRLKAGDMVVQQATNHGWVNHGTEPCRILFVLMDAKEP